MAMLTDGFPCTISFSAAPGLLFRERETQPGDLELGEIDVATMRQTRFRPKAPKALLTVGPIVVQIMYDPVNYSGPIIALFGVIQTIVVTFPDLAGLTFTGWIDKFKPASLKEGEFPLAELTLVPSNATYGGAGPARGVPTEVGPVYVAAPGPRPAAPI